MMNWQTSQIRLRAVPPAYRRAMARLDAALQENTGPDNLEKIQRLWQARSDMPKRREPARKKKNRGDP